MATSRNGKRRQPGRDYVIRARGNVKPWSVLVRKTERRTRTHFASGGCPMLRDVALSRSRSSTRFARQPEFQPRSGGMRKPGTAVPGKLKANKLSPQERTAQVSQQPSKHGYHERSGRTVTLPLLQSVRKRRHQALELERKYGIRYQL